MDEFQSWGWRIPFLSSAIVVGFGLWIRHGVDETPLYRQLSARHAQVKAPISEVVRGHWRRLLIAGGSRIGSDVLYSLLATFTITYLTAVLHQSRGLALSAVSIGVAVNAVSVPICGSLSDRFGRRIVCGVGASAAMLWAFVFFRLLDTLDPWTVVLAVASGFFIHAFMYGPQAAFITEQFPTRVRYAGASIAYTWVGIFGGGIAPAMFATLLRTRATTLSISVYLAGALCVTGIALILARETAQVPLD